MSLCIILINKTKKIKILFKINTSDIIPWKIIKLKGPTFQIKKKSHHSLLKSKKYIPKLHNIKSSMIMHQ